MRRIDRYLGDVKNERTVGIPVTDADRGFAIHRSFVQHLDTVPLGRGFRHESPAGKTIRLTSTFSSIVNTEVHGDPEHKLESVSRLRLLTTFFVALH